MAKCPVAKCPMAMCHVAKCPEYFLISTYGEVPCDEVPYGDVYCGEVSWVFPYFYLGDVIKRVDILSISFSCALTLALAK